MQSFKQAAIASQLLKSKAVFSAQAASQRVSDHHPLIILFKQAFANLNKKDIKFNKKWEPLAAKELKGKDVHETLVRETNEQILIKALYTSEDWQAPKEVEVPGKFANFIYY